MDTFFRRMIRAALLDTRVYEEVESDRRATGQAVVVVLLASIAGGLGLSGGGVASLPTFVTGVIGALVGWIAWATLTYLIGTRLLPEPQTRANVGELLRTVAFAASPGLLRGLGVIPLLGWPIYLAASLWMLIAMVVAVRQALDYSSTGRAIRVCIVGWALSLAIAIVLGLVFAPTVS